MIPFLRRWSEWRLLRLWLGWQRSSAFLPRSGSEEGRRKGLRTRLHGPWQHRCYVRRSYIRGIRSEERRVGKECRSRWSQCHEKKNKEREKSVDRCKGAMNMIRNNV